MNKRKLKFNLIYFIIFVCLLPNVTGCKSKVFLTNNGYRNLLISIQDTVDKNDFLLERIVNVFTEMSEYLYNATRKRAYVQDVTVLLPGSWSDSKQNIELAVDETEESSDIRIGIKDTYLPWLKDKPEVLKMSPCGQTGEFMFLTPDYLVNTSVAAKYGSYGRALVHSWSHLRYGVFDEYPTPDMGNYFYAGDDGTVEATRCSNLIEGTTYDVRTGKQCKYNNGFPDKYCRFKDNTVQKHSNYGSILYRQFHSFIDGFCDNDARHPFHFHNAMSNSKQNVMCNGMSVWEVLRLHGDFDGINPPRDVPSTTPKFRFVRPSTRRTVLVLDFSDSMRKYNRLLLLSQATRLYLLDFVSDGEEVAVVTFNDNAKVESYLTTINDQSRKLLTEKLPIFASGYTAIGKATLLAIDVLGQSGGNVILVTDGIENEVPSIEDSLPKVIQSKVTINTIALSKEADNHLELLASETGGTTYFYSEDSRSNALSDAFAEIAFKTQKPSQKRVILESNSHILNSTIKTIDGLFVIDESLGKNIMMSFSYTVAEINVTVVTPTGDIIDKNGQNYVMDKRFQTVTIKPPTAKIGKWRYRIDNSVFLPSQKVTVFISTDTSKTEKNKLFVTTRWLKQEINYPSDTQIMFVAVYKGIYPVLKANVVAVMERPNAQPFKLEVLDSGVGADISKDDGVYSTYVAQFTDIGRYNVKVIVNNVPTTSVHYGKIIASSTSVATDEIGFLKDEGRKLLNEDFQRYSSPGSFKLKNFTKGDDLIPPSRVTDLALVSYSNSQQVITITWTAVGDDLDFGTTDKYSLYVSKNFSFVFNESLLLNALSKRILPKYSSGHKETYEYKIQDTVKENLTYFFRLKSVDKRNNWSLSSNILSVHVQQSKDLETANVVGAVLGSIGCVVFVVFICLVIFIFIKKRRKQKVLTDIVLKS